MSDSAFKSAPFPSYTTPELEKILADGGRFNPDAMRAELARRAAAAAGDRSQMTDGERLRLARLVEALPVTERPCGAPGLRSYRYRGVYGWIMIGARDHADALREAGRSLSFGIPQMENLEIWHHSGYVRAE